MLKIFHLKCSRLKTVLCRNTIHKLNNISKMPYNSITALISNILFCIKANLLGHEHANRKIKYKEIRPEYFQNKICLKMEDLYTSNQIILAVFDSPKIGE